MDAIKTTNLTKYYGKSRGVIDLNLTVAEGEFFGFIGCLLYTSDAADE